MLYGGEVVGNASLGHLATWVQRAGTKAAMAVAAALVLTGWWSPPVGAAGQAPRWSPVVVQSQETHAAGPHGLGVRGPATLVAHFAHPTKKGDLLVAAVIDGVFTSGMAQPKWHLPGWRRGAAVIGGNRADGGRGGYGTGGLAATIFYRPDNPGGITAVRLGTIPEHTGSDVTAVVAELSGTPRQVEVVARGRATSGPTPATNTTHSKLRTATPLGLAPDLVLAAFTNGGNAQKGEHFVLPRGWRVIGEDRSAGGIDQPLLFDLAVARNAGTVVHQSITYQGGYPTDNCAVMVALH